MTIGSNGQGTGYFTNGFNVLSGSVLSGASCVPVDTGYQGGAANPQSGGIIPGTTPAPPAQIGVTAQADTTKANATQLGYGVNTLTTVAGTADSVLLPYAFPGADVIISNDGAQSVQIFGRGTDTIDAVATGTGVPLAAGTRALFKGTAGEGDGTDAGAWFSLKGTKAS